MRALRSYLAAVRRRPGVAAGMGAAALASIVLAAAVALVGATREPDLIVGRPSDASTTLPVTASTAAPGGPGPTAIAADAEDGPGVGVARRRPPGYRSGAALLGPRGRPYGGPVPFDADIPVPADLVWVLLIGSDARPGEDVRRARADSIHLVAANPRSGQATVIGFPRDSWVSVPGHGEQKINDAMVLGGPDLVARTVHELSGLPVQYWVLASFTTFARIVDEVGGVTVHVDRRMDDPYSGAHFQPGYHRFTGRDALAFSRNRHDLPDGDFGRSLNHGKLLLAALQKLRAEVGDEAGLRRWVEVAYRHLDLTTPRRDALGLMAVARRTVPERTANLVLPGRADTVGRRSVVLLDVREAARIFDDVRPDAAVGAELPPSTTTSTSPATVPSTTAPAATNPPSPTTSSTDP